MLLKERSLEWIVAQHQKLYSLLLLELPPTGGGGVLWFTIIYEEHVVNLPYSRELYIPKLAWWLLRL